MKIVRLTAENIKRIKAIEITPEGNTVILGGKNAQGKTSVLDSISYAIEGKAAICGEPVRRNTKKGKIVCELDDLIITRTLTSKGGGSLVVAAKDGTKYSSPQTILDKLMGQLGFDPLAFSRMDDHKRLETLKALVGLDFSEQDKNHQTLYQERAVINKEGISLKSLIESTLSYPEALEKEVSVRELMVELDKRQKVNIENKALRNNLNIKQRTLTKIQAEITEQREALKQKEKAQKVLSNEVAALSLSSSGLQDANEDEIRTFIAGAEETNNQIRVNRDKAIKEVELNEKRKKSEKLTQQIQAIADAKIVTLATIKFPVEGLSFDENGVLFNDLPFNQASSAEQLRTSVAMGLAMNPELKVLLIRDGSLLDKDNLKIIADMATQADAQVWIETVSEGEEVNIIIEDGQIKGEEIVNGNSSF